MIELTAPVIEIGGPTHRPRSGYGGRSRLLGKRGLSVMRWPRFIPYVITSDVSFLFFSLFLFSPFVFGPIESTLFSLAYSRNHGVGE